MFCLFGFLTSSSTTRLYRGRVPRLTPENDVLPHTRKSGETMTSASAGHIILTPIQPVQLGAGGHRWNRTRDLLTRSRTLYRLSYCAKAIEISRSASRLFSAVLRLLAVVETSYTEHVPPSHLNRDLLPLCYHLTKAIFSLSKLYSSIWYRIFGFLSFVVNYSVDSLDLALGLDLDIERKNVIAVTGML